MNVRTMLSGGSLLPVGPVHGSRQRDPPPGVATPSPVRWDDQALYRIMH